MITVQTPTAPSGPTPMPTTSPAGSQQRTSPSLQQAEENLARWLRVKKEAAERIAETRNIPGLVETWTEAIEKLKEADRQYREAERDFWRAYLQEHGMNIPCEIESAKPEDILDSLERKILTNLKAYESVYDTVESGPTGEIPKGSDASKVSSAFGHYSNAVAIRHGIPVEEVQKMVPSDVIDATEDELIGMMKADLMRKQEEEKVAEKHKLDIGKGMAEQVRIAIQKFEEATRKRRKADVLLDEMEKLILQNLKGHAARRERLEAERHKGKVPKGSPAAKIESAFGHYAKALAFKYRLPLREVQGLVAIEPPGLSENQLLDMLREDLNRKKTDEKLDPLFMAEICADIEEAIVKLENAIKGITDTEHAPGPDENEMRILQNLKGRESQWTKRSYEEVKPVAGEEPRVEKGSPISHLQRAFDLYAKSVALHNFTTVQRVEQMVPKDVIDMDDQQLLEELKADALRKEDEERRATRGKMDWGITEPAKKAVEEYTLAMVHLKTEE